jgi:aminopeptidase-like protein
LEAVIHKNGTKSGTAGSEMISLIKSLYPICRSITGQGVRDTLAILRQQLPLTVHEVESGTQVLDWTVPNEWNIADAYIKNSRGERVVDFRINNLHVMSYSVPVHGTYSLESLRPHLYTLPDHPDWIPYRTSYYNENWGFCLTQRQYDALQEDEYEVCIDSSLAPGSLTYGEYVLHGETVDEVLISTHICHPSLCNDNLSGIAVATFLANTLREMPLHRYTYRFLFIPGTIGSITWLAEHEDIVPRIKHGMVLNNLGDSGHFHYKRTRRGDAEIDRVFAHLFEHHRKPSVKPDSIIDFYPYGYDERQFNSPGFNMPVGGFMRSQHGTFPQYHTSADDLTFVQPEHLAESLQVLLDAMFMLENNRCYRNLNPKGEPQLGRRGIYKAISGQQNIAVDQMALLWVLNLSDGDHSLLDIAERARLPFRSIHAAAQILAEHDLLAEMRSYEPE